MSKPAVWIASVVAVPLISLALSSVARTAREMSDPCTQWIAQDRSRSQPVNRRGGVLGGVLQAPSPHQTPLRFAAPCTNRVSAIGESKRQAAITLAAVPGGLLLGSLMGLAGAIASWPALLLFGGIILAVESVFVSIGPLIAVGAVLLLVASYKVRRANRVKTIH